VVRLWSVYEGKLSAEELTLGEMVVMEGLAVTFSAAVVSNKFPVIDENALLMPKEDFEFCHEHREELISEILEHWNKSLTSKLMSDYMMGSSEWENGRPPRIGYFVGAQIVSAILAPGFEIDVLTKMPARKILELFYSRKAS